MFAKKWEKYKPQKLAIKILFQTTKIHKNKLKKYTFININYKKLNTYHIKKKIQKSESTTKKRAHLKSQPLI
jgi:hypothetical protein